MCHSSVHSCVACRSCFNLLCMCCPAGTFALTACGGSCKLHLLTERPAADTTAQAQMLLQPSRATLCACGCKSKVSGSRYVFADGLVLSAHLQRYRSHEKPNARWSGPLPGSRIKVTNMIWQDIFSKKLSDKCRSRDNARFCFWMIQTIHASGWKHILIFTLGSGQFSLTLTGKSRLALGDW